MKSIRSFLSENRIPTRYPEGKMFDRKGLRIPSIDDPTNLSMRVDIDAMKRNRKSFDSNMEMLRDSKVYQDLPKSRIAHPVSTDNVAENYIEHFKDNILHIHDSIPSTIRNRSAMWYDGANKITKKISEIHGIPHHVVSAVFAALSPQNEWNNNVALGERTIDIYHNQKDHPWSPQMEEHSRRIWKEKDQPLINLIRGKRLNDLSDPAEKAMWIRTYDEAHNPRPHYKITPEGEKTNAKSTATKWQSVAAIAKAVNLIESNGDIQKISHLMGSGHKIRNFYNNIQEPNNPSGDVTIDTHAVAAAHLKPFSTNSMEVNHAFGTTPVKRPDNWVPVKKGGSSTGINGTDPLYEEAYRRASSERGILPRQMQSIVWEGIRGMFPKDLKRGNTFNDVYRIWSDHHNGLYDADAARKKIDTVTNGGAGNVKYGWD